jgi:hypothetical protein
VVIWQHHKNKKGKKEKKEKRKKGKKADCAALKNTIKINA